MLIMSETKPLSKSFLSAHFLFSLETVLPLTRCLLTAGNQTLASIENRGCETKVLCCDYLLFLAFVAELFTF